MENFEQSTSFSSDSSPLKNKTTERSSDEEDVLGIAEQESETVAADRSNLDDSKDYDADDGDEERDMEENEEAARDGTRSPENKSQSANDAFDAFEFVCQEDTSLPGLDNPIEEEVIPEASDWLDGGKLYTAHVNRARHFVCVDYPGVIENQDKALVTLGGLDGLSKVLSEDLKLELAFRPNDPYCKPTIGSYTHSRNLLLKIRRRKVVSEDVVGSGSSNGDVFEYQVEVVGVVGRVYIFDKLCDFQYLPVAKEPDGTYQEILSSIRPKISDDRREYLSRNIPIFLPPYSFSRRELPVSYNFETDNVQPGEESENVIGIDRKKRFLGTIQISYNSPGVPTEPDPLTCQHLKKLPNESGGLEHLGKLFEERPIWSRVGIVSRLDKVHHGYLKYLLPVVAYYFVNGPWKNLWCKFGYDPRKDATAKIYQTLDYRVRSIANRQKVEPKRGQDVNRGSHYGLKHQWNTTLINKLDDPESSQTGATSQYLTYIFTPDHIPPYRQMRYQVCDVRLEEVQKRMHENDGQETICTERDGWCVPDFTDVCRDLISASVEKLFAK